MGSMKRTELFSLEPIGYVRSMLKDRADAPRQGSEGAPEAWLELLPAMTAGLERMKIGDEVLVFTWLHEARRDVLKVHPRDDLTQPLTGVFLTRSPDRPNPIGLHRVKVLALDGARMRVAPLEAIDGTPIIDLKPVLGPQDR
jgi:tRNA-Thr(GGU) m(6)t(6)A37 methyltransferase TsaA